MGFFRHIADRYGSEAATTLKTWAKNNKKLASFVNRRIFLLRCKNNDLTPRHLLQNLNCLNSCLVNDACSSATAVDSFGHRLKTKLIKLEINITEKHISYLNKCLVDAQNRASVLLPNFICKNFQDRQTVCYNRLFAKIRSSNLRKFQSLKSQYISEVRTQDKWLVNLSNVQIPPNVHKILALGPKFGFAPQKKHISIKTLLSEVEDIVRCCDNSVQDILRAQATNIVTNFVHKDVPRFSFISRMFNETKNFLNNNKDLIVLNSDKGNVSVVWDRASYIQKLSLLIDDVSVYKLLNSDPTNKFQRLNNNKVKLLVDKGYISPETGRKLKTYKSTPPLFYGLPKVHKQDIPLRPIVSTICSPTSALSKYIADILKVSFENYNRFSVKDSWTFANIINNFKLPEGYVIISLDVVSLFTNISLELVLKIISDEWPFIEPHTHIPKIDFCSVVKFLFESTYFLCNGNYYSQIFGTPMGSCLSPIIANVVMTKLLNTCTPKLPFQLPFLYQYVDDLILTVPINSQEVILEVFNSFDPHLKFTVEEEKDNSVPFLDTKLVRSADNVIKLDWYQKPMSSGRYINSKSYHSLKMKCNIINGLKTKINRITHPSFRQEALKRLFNLMLENGYSKNFLNRLIFANSEIHTTVDVANINVSNQEQVTKTRPVAYRALPYVEGLTHKFVNLFSVFDDIKLAQYNVVTNRTFFKNIKDTVPILNRSNVIYQIKCRDCSLSYIGQTSQTLRNRITLHKSDTRLRPQRCALATHTVENNHEMDFDSVKILAYQSNFTKRAFLEMCYINEIPCMNSKTDLENLSNIYSFLLHVDKNRKQTPVI